MSDFTDRELLLMLNSTHERAGRLLDAEGFMQQESYRDVTGKRAGKKALKTIKEGHIEHFALVEKIRKVLSEQ